MATVRAAMARNSRAEPVPVRFLPAELPAVPSGPARRSAAVLCGLFEEGDEAHIILTRRSSRMRSHTSEVSFPGGRLEEGEAPVAAALREASEEVGLNPGDVEIIGPLSPLATFGGQVLITPFLGLLPARPLLRPSPEEVERAFDVSLAELVSDDVYREEMWLVPGAGWRAINFFELIGDTVWGATARILRELLELTICGRPAASSGQ
ncbi:MAG: CoA pyrophosphatase [Actinomycetota bacterium]|nr:CoA pyrophosphatase [Actinomycetota bacterium]